MFRTAPVVVLLATFVVPLFAQPNDNAGQSSAESIRTLGPVANEFRKLGDWKPHADMIDDFVGEVFKSNGWSSDEDRFALELTRRITGIPPWEIDKRLNMFVETVGQRYQFDPSQKNKLKSRVMREAVGMFAKNAGVITGQAREFIRNRSERKPFTSEQVARMTDESDDLMADAIFRMDRIASDMRKIMTEKQKALMDRDYQAFDHRLNDMLKLRAAWSQGKWKPEDWGMKNDPIQKLARSMPPTQPTPVTRPVPPSKDVAPAWRAEDESTWGKWVRLFIKQHELDPGQIAAIESILSEMQTRASNYRTQHADALPDPAISHQAGSPDSEPLRALFDELKSRSHALLRNTQRLSDAETDAQARPSSTP